ncbi:glucosylceramide transporter ABCA12 isoform X17 [Epinephelus fuscoguttatus]|uniref:glucosylceramide transporter ABCA12 isoform X6 n=1 Tax=Epinephelus fuscoguttatus TaxID=293821 RepID=UPI0020CFFB9F|nr:glucosylceramide transporter ABCA12 isoform X6 [Epinephelus fuscoguttatus]XP_049449725.1 glucosylceramide transporter ABCA12 isoform X7 [Epinephelus fuscoguttatus]XP_049449726.1 glucosylceramide transporter ABCA12 isoform X8 [Epinephelus fuscoguttatus]XP_049449727.1 glucosylceramide transporter ABCA12 isoform X9 [Epinephelus fuscoguttatus]XP_049449728.1 glucosylceramide transporter ABCA12 isoform X10 [Epinephelus fuscoguttatus]XP_049449729.1 glucosylceramide transporter ABCA12 isoform X11 [
MAFFRQLKLLLWKNGLAVIRQPLWSLTLVIWPLIIFIIIAVTRNQFPPVIKDTCYVGARNLPSSGFFPFLQTLMCNTDGSCHNKSHLAGSAASKSSKRYSREASPDHPLKVSPMANLIEGAGFFNISRDPNYDPEKLIKAMNSFLGSSYQGMSHNASLMNGMNTTLLGDEESVNEMLDSMNLLKRAMCTLMLPRMNTTSPDALSYAVVTFCRSNNSLFEVSLNTLNQILTDLILTKPNETLTVAGAAVLVFDQLQNQTALWETLLNVPQLFSSGSFDEMLASAGTLLTNIQRAMHVLQGNFPEASASLSPVHPLLAGGINLVHYAQNWPGKDVSISLREVVTLENDTLGDMVRLVLQEVTIPLDKAIFLTLDREMVLMYVCENSSNPFWLTAACSTGAVDMLLGWISPGEVAKQVLRVWSEHVAPHDISFAKGLLHSLMGGPSPGGPGGSNITRTHRSVVTQPQNPEEELFLGVGQLVMETIAFVPELDMVVQVILKTGFQSMRSVAQALETAEELVGSVLECAHHLKMTYLTLLTNQTEANVWIGRVRGSVMEVITEMQSPEPSTCEDVLGPFEWLLTSENVPVEIWKALICQDTSPLEQALQAGRLPLVQKAQDVYNTITEQTDDNVTLPMILSEWHKLQNFSMQFGMLLDTLVTGLGGAYWMDWMPDNNDHNVTETLQQSVFLFMVNVGEQIEESQLWPEVKNSVHALYWILNYSPGVTTQPANCSINIYNQVLECNTGLNWPQFVQRMTQVLMSPNQDVLVQCLKGTVNLLQHAYDDVFQQMIGSGLKQEITGGDALSAYLINLMRNLASFVNSISMLPDENIADPDVMLPHIGNLLQSVGLRPLLPLLVSEGPVNVSTVLDVASKIGRLNQHIFTFNETDPTMPELERLIRFFLSLEGNLTISLSHIMGHTLLTYSDYFHPDDAAHLIQAIRPFTNQTSAGVVEAILSAMELLKTVMDSPNGDPTNIILGYIRQLQEFVMSLYRLRKIQHFPLPNGQLSPAQVNDLHLLSKDFLGLLTPESLQNLSQAGPDAALEIVAQKIVAFLPPEVQLDAARFLQDFVALQSQVTRCAAGQDCLAGISELFTFLDQILDIMLAADSNVTVTLANTNSVLEGREREEIVSQFFPLLLSSNDAANVETFKQILHFARLIMATPNITVSDVQNALQQSNLTLEELNNITALAGAANINDLVVNIMEIINARECFEPQHNQMVTAQCIMGLIDDVSNFLSNIPALRDQAAIVSLIPLIVNNTIRDGVQADFSSNANIALAHTLNSTLANIKMNLQLNNLYTPEIMNEIRVVEGLIQLLVNMEPLNKLNATSDMDSTQAQKVYVEMVQWYLEKLENITRTSSISDLLQPFYYITHMQVTLQLTQLDFTLFVSKQVETLIYSLQHPIDSAGVSAIGQTAVEILRRLFELLQINLEAQNELSHNLLFNTTTLHAFELQVNLYLSLIEIWMKQPNVSPVLSSMLQWGNPDLNASTPVTDFQHLLQTMVHFLSEDQQAYLSIIHNATMLLSNALMVAEQPGGLQSDHFLSAILEAVQTAMQSLTTATGPLPPSVQQNILEIVQDSLRLIVQPDMSFATSRNISLLILQRAESIIQQTLAEMGAEYLLPGIRVATTYFESISASSGPDRWNQLILDEMETLQSVLPPNNPAQAYISVLINITRFILESGQGNMSLWDSFESASEDNLPLIFSQMGRLLNMLWPLITGGPDLTTPSLEGFAHLAPVLEHVLTGKADQMTWDELERILEALLSTLSGTEIWDSVPPVIQVFEQVIGSTVNNIEAQNVLILSLQTPVATLMIQLAQSVNSSHFNLTEFSERMQLAIERTLQAVEQANGTLECSEVLRAWEPVREAAGLNHSTLAMWCNINLQPLLEAYAEANAVYAHMNMSHMGVGPMTVSATAARIVRSIQSLYQVNINSTLVTGQLIEAFISQLSVLAGQPLSHEAQLHWFKQLQNMQLQSSLSSLKMLSDELVKVAPFMQPCMEALQKTVHYILDNYHRIEEGSSSEELFGEAIMIFLSSANITSDDMMLGQFSEFSEASLIDIMREAMKLMIDIELFGDAPMIYQAMEQFLANNDSRVMIQKVAEMFEWFASTQASGLDLLIQALPKICDILRPLWAVLTQMNIEIPPIMEQFEDILAVLRQFILTSGSLTPMDHYPGMFQQEMTGANHTMRVRNRRETSLMPARTPMDDFIDLFQIDYPAMFRAISAPVSSEELTETIHMFFANPDLSVVVKGATGNMPWGMAASREGTIDAALGMLSFFTIPGAFQMSSMDPLMNAANMLPDDFPFSSLLKNITRVLAGESQENLMLIQEAIQTAAALLEISPTDPRFTEQLGHLESKVCDLEETETVRLLMSALSIRPGQLCHTLLPSLKALVESLINNTTYLTDIIFQAVIGDPKTYNVHTDWSSALSQGLGFNISSLRSLNINITSPGVVTVGEMLRDKEAFIMEVQQRMNFDPAALHLLMATTLPNNNLEILSWLVNLRHCNSTAALEMKATDVVILKTFCSMSVEQWYTFSLLMARHLNMEKFIYRMVLSEEIQSLMGVMIKMAEVIIDMMDMILPAVGQLRNYMVSIQDLNLPAEHEFDRMVKGHHDTISTRATFVTLSRALCSKGIVALLGISKLPTMPDSNSSFLDQRQREEMIERFKIPKTASPFCMNMYLDMVNTTGGAIAWAFLKPMLMGQILYTPDTPITRAIMEKANATLQVFANLRKYSKEWIDSSNYIMNSAEILRHTLPMLQNSLGNSFVQNFIEMQTDINVGRMKETLSNFSNMTIMLEKNKHIMDQITTLSTLMVNLSSCIKFDRYRGYDTADQMNAEAQDLAKNRDLYASVIFKLPKDEGTSRKRHARSSSSTSSLPPKVSYTIRMHMDNVMRTDRVRSPYYVKENHIWSKQTLRYNRGFVYLQENIDRAIIETQTGQKVTDPAVQLQPFPYPCYYRDEYLEAISFVFPLMLMIAWVLFVADFVKKLVHERELRLHEYMKMMGVNPLSHFFAWFLECASYLLMTIFILTLVLKYGNILPNSDGFLLFLYLCDYGLSILSFSYLVSSFFDKTYIAALSGSLLYILCFFPFIVVIAMETNLTFSEKSALSLFSPTCFSYASQYVSRYESQGEGIHWSNSYTSPMSGDTASFGWLCWLMLIDSILYFIIGAYIRMVFPGKYGIPAPWYFPFKASFWADLCCCVKSKSKVGRGLLFSNIMQKNQPVFSDDKEKGQSTLSSQTGEDFSELPVGVALHGLSKIYGDRVAIENLNVAFYEGHVTSLLGHNGAGKTTTMSLLTGLFAPSSGSIEVYGRDMQSNIEDIRRELGVCMQYDVLFDHMTAKEHLLLYGQIKAPHWSHKELREQVRTILEETGMYVHRHKRVGTLSGGMRRKLSISIAFIGGSHLVVLDEPTTGVDPCSRRHIWDIVIQHKKNRTVIMSTHHLDEAEVLSDRIAFLERGGLKCCGSPFYLKDKLGQGYKLTLTKKVQNLDSEPMDNAEMKAFIQAHVPEARLKEAQGSDLVYSLPPFTSSNASSYRSLLTALDSNLDALQLGGYGISDTTLEEVFLQLTHGSTVVGGEDGPLSISETISDTDSIDSFPSDSSGSIYNFGDKIKLTGSSVVRGMALAWQQMAAMLIKRFHHSRRDWKGLISQILLPVLFIVFAMGLSSIKKDLRHYPELELSPALYNFEPSYSFFSNKNPNSAHLVDTMMSFPGIDNACLAKPSNPVCTRSTNNWSSRGNSSKPFNVCKCTHQEQICDANNFQPPHKKISSSQIMYNLSGIDVEKYLVATTNDFIRNRYGGFSLGMPLPPDLLMDITAVPKNRTLSKVWFNPEGHHTMPAYLNSLNNIILRANLPADKDPHKYAISVSSHPYFGRADDEDSVVQGMLQILVAMCVLTGYSITTASFAIYEVSEHHSGSKRLQHISGISEPFYWAVNFFYDMLMYLIPVTLTVAVIAAFQIPAFTDRQNLGAVTLLLVLFGFSTFPWMYLLSGVFKDAEMAFIAYVCINLFITTNTILSTSILYFMNQISINKPEFIQELFERLSYAFLIFPQFNFGNGLVKLARMNIEVQLLSGYGIDAYKNPFSMEALGWMLICSFIQGVVFFTLRLLLNRFLIRKVRNMIRGSKKVLNAACEDEDEDVAAERQRVSSGAASTDLLQVNQLTKVYQHLKRKIHAVKKLSVGIPAGECFGLLGVNGAGKTTTFKMLTGDVSPTDGTAQIRDWDGRLVDIMECRNKGINIGYCPQVDALDNLLTGEEHLYFYARIRGVSKREIDRVVNYLLKRLELSYHRSIITDGYSCGTRRKLSTALALIGHPQILLLDEPSSGMDPHTKRHLWKIISEEVKGKCAVVLTSHSMEECEALCGRLAIMVKGQFRCLGSLQHIKNRFGSGFTVKMYLAKASCDAEAITGFMQRRFPSTYLKDQHSTMVEYHVPIAPGGVADIFSQLESNKNALQIKHFSVSQTTLDEVFINFAMGKIAMESIALNSEDEECNVPDSIKAVET